LYELTGGREGNGVGVKALSSAIFGTGGRHPAKGVGEPNDVDSGLVGLEDSKKPSTLSKTEGVRNAERGELGVEQEPREAPVREDCIDQRPATGLFTDARRIVGVGDGRETP
jgi:hypothetical protein